MHNLGRLVICAVCVTAALTSNLALAWNDTLLEGDEMAAVSAPPPDVVPPMRDVLPGVRSPAQAWKKANELVRSGQFAAALPELDAVEAAYPRVTDRVELLRGAALIGIGDSKGACVAYDSAIKNTIDATVEAYARVGGVRCLLVGGNPRAASALTMLEARYPALPPAAELQYELASMYEKAGKSGLAVPIYRRLELNSPGTAAGQKSHARLLELAASGLRIAPLSPESRIMRAEKLVTGGPMGLAKDEVQTLLSEKLPPTQHANVLFLAARIARVEGRFEDVKTLLREAKGLPSDEREARNALDAATAATAREQADALRMIGFHSGRKSFEKLPPPRLSAIVGIAARAGLTAELNDALTVLLSIKKVHPDVLFQAAVESVGLADDGLLERLFARSGESPKWRVAALYHQARALERMGKISEAAVLFEQVKSLDDSETRYYAMWAMQRLGTIEVGITRQCAPDENADTRVDVRTMFASLDAVPTSPVLVPIPKYEGMTSATGSAASQEVAAPRPDSAALAERLREAAYEYMDEYPWLARARDLLLLDDQEAATEELHEAYLAWRDASGRPIRRAGVESVFRGKDRVRKFIPFKLKRARKLLSVAERRSIADVASALGDEGTAAGIGGWTRVAARPRAYSDLVQRVAARHGLDPDLLFAVMRVESVYQRRIVSMVGAVGLMQIMPRTGNLIAQRLGRDDFTAVDLLDPETNLDFAAWYLASLIQRFDGHLPLAIAAYNGGPHNVRRWMWTEGEHMPMDAFLETIPFTETSRYVRRVLTHYAAYRAQHGEPMESLSLELPPPKTDTVAF